MNFHRDTMNNLNKYITKDILSVVMGAMLGCGLAYADEKADNRILEKQPDILFRNSDIRSTAAISSISGDDAFKTPTTNLTNTLYGRLAGLAVMQGSGQLGYDIASMTIRGKGTFNNDDSFTVFVDGFETDPSFVSTLLPSEIANVYVLKDAAALSVFGMKGANGVLWIETKRGEAGKIKVDLNLRTGWQKPKQLTKPLGSARYASLYNEALSNDNGNIWTPYYSDDQIDRYAAGQDTDTDWYDETLKSNGHFTSTDLAISGGNSNVKFFTLIGYMNANGFYNVNRDDTHCNTRFDQYTIRTNLDFTMFKIFEGRVDLGGRMIDNKRPNFSDDELWYNLSTYPNNIYGVFDGGINDNEHWSGTATHPNNPVASIRGLGFRSNRDRSFQANFSLKEKLDFITKGLYLSEAASFSTWTRGSYKMNRSYARMFNGKAQTSDLNTDYAPSDDRGTNQWTWNQFRLRAGYDRQFGLHDITATVDYENYTRHVDADMNGKAGVQTEYGHQALNGRANYMYDSRYVAEFGFSYCGSDNYAKGNRYKFYPAVSGAWIISNENFLKSVSFIDLLKLRLSYGTSGYDYYSGGRYLFTQYYVAGNTFPVGNDGNPTWEKSLIPAYLANPDITAEKSTKYDIGINANVFSSLRVTFDLFQDKRSDIVTIDNHYPAGVGVTPPYRNIGKVTTKGLDLTLNYNKSFGDFWFSVGGTLSYVKDKINYLAEIAPASPLAAQTGNCLGAIFGYKALGFYDINDFEADGSLKSTIATPTFGTVQPGDIRYADINGDNIVNEQDMQKISSGSTPNLYYSLTANFAYKGFDFGLLFQGVGNRDINLLNASNKVIAFRNNSNVYSIAEGRWAYYPEQNIDTRANATYPRLSTADNSNNYKNSTMWIKDGSFITLRNIELGYTLPKHLSGKIGMQNLRIYVNGVNLLTFSSLKKDYDMDPERMTGYPGIKSYNVGLTVGF